MNKRHRFILIADDQAIIEFNSGEPYTPEKAKLLSQQVTNLMKTRSTIILSPDFEFIDRRPGYLRIEERLQALERMLSPQTVNTKTGMAVTSKESIETLVA